MSNNPNAITLIRQTIAGDVVAPCNMYTEIELTIIFVPFYTADVTKCSLKVYDPITFGFIYRNGVFVSDESPYFSH